MEEENQLKKKRVRWLKWFLEKGISQDGKKIKQKTKKSVLVLLIWDFALQELTYHETFWQRSTLKNKGSLKIVWNINGQGFSNLCKFVKQLICYIFEGLNVGF